MNIQLCIAWFIFGFIVGMLTLIAVAVIVADIKEENKDGKNKESVREQSSNHDN